MAKKIRTHDEENKNRLKTFAENLVHTDINDITRFSPKPSRFKAPDKLTPAQIEWFRKHRDDFE